MTINTLKITSIIHLASGITAVGLTWIVGSASSGYGMLALVPVLGVLALVAAITGATLLANSETIIGALHQLSTKSRVLFTATGISVVGWILILVFIFVLQ